MSSDLYQSSFGGVQLWLSRISTTRSRSLVKHSPSAGDDHTVQDRGRELTEARASVLLDWMDGDDLSPTDRLRKLLALVDDKPRLFSHPIEGSFLARVGPFTYDIDAASGTISAELEFTPVQSIDAVAPVGGGMIPATGVGAVSMAAEALAFELEDSGLPASTIPAAAVAAADGWATSDSVNPRDVLAQTGSLSQQLGDQADSLDGDIELWSAFKATIVLAATVRAVAEDATAETAQTFVMKLGAPVALRALLASLYPAEDADAYYERVMWLNDIASPAWVDPGTLLTMPLPSTQPRNG